MDQLRENGWEKETHTSDEINEEEIRKVFSIVDRDSSGFLSKKEAKRACKLIADKFGVTEVDIYALIMILGVLSIEGGVLALRAGYRWGRPAELCRVQNEHRWKPSH